MAVLVTALHVDLAVITGYQYQECEQRERETLPWPLLGTLIRMLEVKRTNSVPWTEIRPFAFVLKPSCELTPRNKRCNYTSCGGHRPAGHFPVPRVLASCINKRETQILIRVLLFRCERWMLCSEQHIPRTNFVLEWAVVTLKCAERTGI